MHKNKEHLKKKMIVKCLHEKIRGIRGKLRGERTRSREGRSGPYGDKLPLGNPWVGKSEDFKDQSYGKIKYNHLFWGKPSPLMQALSNLLYIKISECFCYVNQRKGIEFHGWTGMAERKKKIRVDKLYMRLSPVESSGEVAMQINPAGIHKNLGKSIRL